MAWLICGGIALFCAGCGRAANSHPTARLEGQVTIDGQSIHAGRIQFFPASAVAATEPVVGSGQPDDAEIVDGHYLAERTPRGKVHVSFTAIKETGRTISEGGHTFPERVSVIPAAYQGGVDIDVSGDNPNQDFALVSKPPPRGGKGG